MLNESKSITELIPDFDEKRYGFDVPEMPPVDNRMSSDSHLRNWLWLDYDSTNHSYRNDETLHDAARSGKYEGVPFRQQSPCAGR